MHFTQPQIYEVLEQVLSNEDGLEQILKMSLESLMKSERTIHNESTLDLSNGFRTRRTFGRGKILELRVPRTRSGSFYPLILALLKDQEEEAFKLYSSGLTIEQVGDLFGEIYGKNYSTSQVSRLFDYTREEVQEWIERHLDNYYPICYLYIDKKIR